MQGLPNFNNMPVNDFLLSSCTIAFTNLKNDILVTASQANDMVSAIVRSSDSITQSCWLYKDEAMILLYILLLPILIWTVFLAFTTKIGRWSLLLLSEYLILSTAWFHKLFQTHVASHLPVSLDIPESGIVMMIKLLVASLTLICYAWAGSPIKETPTISLRDYYAGFAARKDWHGILGISPSANEEEINDGFGRAVDGLHKTVDEVYSIRRDGDEASRAFLEVWQYLRLAHHHLYFIPARRRYEEGLAVAE